MSRVREMNTFDGRQVESGEQGVTLFLVFRDFHDELVPDRFEVIKGLCSFLRVIDIAGKHYIEPTCPVF